MASSIRVNRHSEAFLPGSSGYAAVPSYMDLSTGRCAPIASASTGVVPNPQALPLGVGVPAQQGVKSHMGSIPTGVIPSQAPISAEVAKADYASQASIGQQQQQQYAGFGSPQMYQQQQQQQINASASFEALSATKDIAACANSRTQYAQFAVKADQSDLQSLLDKMKTRRLAVSIDFSCHQAANNPSATKRSVLEAARDIFRYRAAESGAKERIGEVRNGIIMGARILGASSTCKVPVGVKLSGIKGNTYTLGGKRYPLVLNYNDKVSAPSGITVHRIAEALDIRRLERYGNLTMEKVMRTIKVITDQPFSFVEVSSPIMEIIETNQDRLRIDLSQFHTINNQFYIVDNGVVKACCEVLQREFFDRMPFTNLGSFEVQVERADGKPWDSADGIDGFNANNDRVVTDALTKHNRVYLWLELDFVLHRPGIAQTQQSEASVARNMSDPSLGF